MTARRAFFVFGLWSAVGAGCVASRAEPVSPAEPVDRWAEWKTDEVRSRLGAGFGKLVVIEAVVVAMPGKHLEGELVVLRIDDRPAPADLRILWTYGGWFAERATETGSNGFTVNTGVRYRLRGYESGRWAGMVPAAHDVLDDEYGVPQGKGLAFHALFRVLDGERLGISDSEYQRWLTQSK